MSKKKPFEVKAGLIQKASNYKGSLTSVLAVKVPDDYKVGSVETSKVKCGQCNTPFSTNKTLASTSSCVVCGSDEVQEVEDTEVDLPVEEFEDEDELAAIKCNHCTASNIMSLASVKLFDGKVNCVLCGTEVEYDVPEDETDDVEEVDNMELDDSDDAVDFEDTEELEEETANSTEYNDNDHIGDENGQNDKLKVNDGNSVGKTVTLPEKGEGNKPHPKGNEGSGGVHASAEDETINADPGAGAGQLEIFDDDEISLHETVAGAFTVERIGNKIYAFKNDTPVAVLKEENAGENKNVFNSKSLVAGISNHLKNNRNVDQALANYNFEVTKVKFPYSKLVAEKVESKLSEKKAEVASSQDDYQRNFKQCLELSAVGLNKNFFGGNKRHVLKAALVEKFEAAGVRDANKIVAKVFAEHNEAYSKLLLETANKLMQKSVSVRNELAETMGDVDLTLMEDEDENDFEDEGDISEARLEQATLPSSPKKSNTESKLETSSVGHIVSDLRAKRGRLF